MLRIIIYLLFLFNFIHTKINIKINEQTYCTWIQNPVLRSNWSKGSPPGSGSVDFCNINYTFNCPDSPPNSSYFAQMLGISGQYFIRTPIECQNDTINKINGVNTDVTPTFPSSTTSSTFPSNPYNYVLEFINFDINGINLYPPDFAILSATLNNIYNSDLINLLDYSQKNWSNYTFHFDTKNNLPAILQINYFIGGFKGDIVRIIFEGLYLYPI